MLPQALVPSNPDSLVMGLMRVLEHHSNAPERLELYNQILVCAVALAPHAGIKDMDLSMVRLAAVRMALFNRHQQGRNYAETALLLAGDVARRARIALLCHGDVYARNNNLHEALIAACCGLNTTVGLVKYAFEAGCKCVVASPWPLDSRVPAHWLPAFLAAWKNGKAVIDATYEANQAVKTRFSPEQRDYLAMTVYGDGLRTRAPRPKPDVPRARRRRGSLAHPMVWRE